MERGHLVRSTERGRISVSTEAIEEIVGRTVAECYGVVGTSPRSRVPRRLSRDRPTRGIAVAPGAGGLEIGVHVVVEYGLNLAEVAATVRSRVVYEVERLTELKVASVDVHIRDARRSP